MKKLVLLLLTTIFLSSCNLSMGSVEQRYWIVYKVKDDGIRNSNDAIYTVKSFDSDGYCHFGFKFKDQYGRFQVGDTVKLVKLNYR